MAILTILEFPDPKLRIKAVRTNVIDEKLQSIIENMLETMYSAPGIGLAATQVNIHKRLLVADVTNDQTEPYVLINPEIIHKEGKTVTQEGCLSVPDYYADVERAEKIVVNYLDQEGKMQKKEFNELLAVCIQHEIDHLDGKLFVDYLSEAKRQKLRRSLKKGKKQKSVPNSIVL